MTKEISKREKKQLLCRLPRNLCGSHPLEDVELAPQAFCVGRT